MSAAEQGQDATTLEGGSYEVIRRRLREAADGLVERAEALNAKRTEVFGGRALAVQGQARVRTENNCVPRDIVGIGDVFAFAYNVFLGLKNETSIADVFSLHRLVTAGDSIEVENLGLDAVPGLFSDRGFQKDFAELYRYYKDAQLLTLRRIPGKLLAVFRIGQALDDIKVFQWAVSPTHEVTYIDNQGEREHTFASPFDFEWTPTTRENHVRGRHPHVNIENEVFVETVGGDLTVKIEDNTEDGQGIFRELVDDPRQALDDAEIEYARVGGLILIRVLPYREEIWRTLIYNTRTKEVVRIDAVNQACRELPEDHGVVFPGGTYLQRGEAKVFDHDITDLIYERSIRSPNGEDVLYVFYHQHEGRYLLLPYNLIRQEVTRPLEAHGYTVNADGRLLLFRAQPEATRVHPIQAWGTPFVSEEFAAAAPAPSSPLAKIGNAELVRGISDALEVRRFAYAASPTQRTYEDLRSHVQRMVDAYFWYEEEAAGKLAEPLGAVRENAALIISEFEKVVALTANAKKQLEEASLEQQRIIADLRPEDWDELEPFLRGLNQLRTFRGHLVTLKDVRLIDEEALAELDKEVQEQFERCSRGCVRFLLDGDALGPLNEQLDTVGSDLAEITKATEMAPLSERLEELASGLDLLSETFSGLEIDDPTQRTSILQEISETFARLNRARAQTTARRKELSQSEGRAEFAAQFKLLGQATSSAIALADTPDKCDQALSRLMVQLEELEGRFSEFDDYLEELTAKREEIYDAFEAKKQELVEAKQRRAENLASAANRILSGVARRAKGFKEADELNAYFAADPMTQKLRGLTEELRALGDGVKADDIEAKLKASKQEAIRNLRDRQDLFEDGGQLIKLGKHRFSVNTQPFEVALVPKDGEMRLHLSGTDYYGPVGDEAFEATRPFWNQTLVSEAPNVYRGEYLAASILFAAEQDGTLKDLLAAHEGGEMLARVQQIAAERYDEGYERGIHDADAAKILQSVLSLWNQADLLRYSAGARNLACLYWAFGDDTVTEETHSGSRPSARALALSEPQQNLARRAFSLERLRGAFSSTKALDALANEATQLIREFVQGPAFGGLSAAHTPTEQQLVDAGRYLVRELGHEHPQFCASSEALDLMNGLLEDLDLAGTRGELEEDLRRLQTEVGAKYSLALAWFEAYAASLSSTPSAPIAAEAATALITRGSLDRRPGTSTVEAELEELLGDHPRIEQGKLTLRLDEFLDRLRTFEAERVPAYRAYRELRHEVLESERQRLRIGELEPRVLTSFVRNRLVNEVYLPLMGDNLAKQLGAAGQAKRTDLMGLLLLVSPPGYGKTTLMEYAASRLGMVFVKVNGPSLGHEVTSLDPAEAPNATARQEVEKINFAFEMGNNVMLYLDDIQHTHPELLQKFISLCDAQRRIEGVWNGRTQTYDLRGKKFAVVMAGNPYTESGDKFQVPDMLANRADTYNLGDILDGKDEVFALSYVENALTSNEALAPIAAKSLTDVHRFVAEAKGQPVDNTDYEHDYSAVERDEIITVLKHLLRVQEVLLKVNAQYIASASQDERFRTEPRFQLQGSYRNMNKLAEKLVAAMNDKELDALVKDHYQSEAQTLTSGAEANLLKLGELIEQQTPEQAARWQQIKDDFRRVQAQGGDDDDPATRVTSMLSEVSRQLGSIGEALSRTEEKEATPDVAAALEPHLVELGRALKALGQPQLDLRVVNESPPAVQAALTEQVEKIEASLVPLLRASTENLQELAAMGQPLSELIDLLRLRLLTESAQTTPPAVAKPAARATKPKAAKPAKASKRAD